MTELRELFEDATQAPPPSRLLADEVYAAGRRRLRRRRAALGGSALAVAVCAMAATVVVAGTGTGPGPSPEDGAATAAPRTSPGVLPGSGRIQMIQAADAGHIYLGLSTCTAGPCKTRVQLVGSADGGRTWTERGTPIHLAHFAALAPDVLLGYVLPAPPSSVPPKLMASRDGGRSWQAPETGPAVPALPSGSFAVCWPDPDADPGGVMPAGTTLCTLRAFDPESNRVSPLVTQPGQNLADQQPIAESAGRLWAPGFERGTGRSAVATSPDGGRTWTEHVFADAPACPVDGCLAPLVAVGPGQVTYAVLNGASERAVYRYTSGQGWQRRTGVQQVPYELSDTGSYVTPDGSHVLYQYVENRGASEFGEYEFWASRGAGADYRPVELDGLPERSGRVSRARDGWLYARGTDDVSYGSTDGWHWVPLNRR
ncbi:sialidase family protein [Plantactinospora solaniradicis]|uniref:Sialidase family protein n=1 Tax=Plantactinospora solaniradicis TaxID=1723736 RepID=A0ABW1K8B0_9ACTN